jgi:hypothetical protein
MVIGQGYTAAKSRVYSNRAGVSLKESGSPTLEATQRRVYL